MTAVSNPNMARWTTRTFGQNFQLLNTAFWNSPDTVYGVAIAYQAFRATLVVTRSKLSRPATDAGYFTSSEHPKSIQNSGAIRRPNSHLFHRQKQGLR